MGYFTGKMPGKESDEIQVGNAAVHTSPAAGDARLSRPARLLRWPVLFLGLMFGVYTRQWKAAPYLSPDTPGYMSLAADVKRLTLTQMHGRTPGFPFFLLLTGADQAPTRSFYYASLALHFGAVLLLAWLLFRFRLPRGAIALFLVVASTPPFVEWAAQMSTEMLSEFLIVLAFALLVAWLATRWTSVLAGYAVTMLWAAFTRPTFQAATLLVSFCLFACHYFGLLRIPPRRLVVSMGLTVAISMAGLGLYSAANYVRFGYFGTSIFPAYAISHKVVGVLEFLPDRDAEIRRILVRHRNELMADPSSDHTGQNYIYRALPELTVLYHGDKVQALRKVQELSIGLIKAKPMSYLNECAKSIGGYWLPNEGPLSVSTRATRIIWDVAQLSIVGLFFLQAAALTGAALFWLPRHRRRHPSFAGTGLALPICAYTIASALIWYTMFISCFAAIGLARYRMPTDMLILFVTLLGFNLWRSLLTAAGPAANCRATDLDPARI
jgi:hypothetical protein